MLNFMKYKLFYFAFSAMFLLPSSYFLFRHGLKPAIDFTGGTLLELTINPPDDQPVSPDQVRAIAEEFTIVHSLQTTGTNTFLLKRCI